MMDIVSPSKRSQMMSGIRGKGTKPEMRVRKVLHAAGYRFRLHRKDLPGTPDVVLPRHRLAIFVHGCFWHAHQGCSLAKIPSTRTEFWSEKLLKNVRRDAVAVERLHAGGWRVLVVWECFLRHTKDDDALLEQLVDAIISPSLFTELGR